jgi:non-ribosomal peptide synthetase component E (peptide arylation enzyme)
MHAGTHLAAFKLPDDVMLVDALPLTPMEKVDRRALARVVENR